MGQPVASMEIDFAMPIAGALADAQTFGGKVEKMAADAVGQMDRVERAAKGMFDTSAAVASAKQFGDATVATSAASIREFNRIERAGESLSRQLDRQLSVFGKTTAEIRQMKVESAALAAEQANMTELAARLRAQEADLWAAEFAAARRQKQIEEELADERAAAAAKMVADKEREAKALRDAAAAYQAFEQRAKSGAAAMASSDNFIGSLQKEADLFGKTAVQIRAMRVEEEALKAERAGMPEQAAQIRAAYQQLLAVEGEHSGKLGFNTTQMMIAQGAAHRYFDSILAGMSPMRAAIMQAGDFGNILAMDNGGVAGGLAKVRALVNPVTVGIAAVTAVVAVGTAAWLSYSNALDKFDQIAHGSGRMIGATGADLEAVAEQAAAASRLTVAGAREIETAYVQTGKIGLTILPGLTAATEDFAKGTGQSLEQAKQQLAAAFADPAKGADELTAKYGILSAATLAFVHDLMDQGRETEAQAALLRALEGQFDGAADHANGLARAWHGIENAAAGAWNWMGKAIDRAMGGASTSELIAQYQGYRDQPGQTQSAKEEYNRRIAALQAQLHQQNNAKARADAVPGLKIVDQFTGDDQLGQLRGSLTAVNKLLADHGHAAGLSAQQVTAAQMAQDAYSRAIQTYMPHAQQQAQLDALDAKIAAARTPAAKAALAEQRERIALSGQVITRAQAEAQAHSKSAAALANASKAGLSHADMLARDAKAMEATIAGTYALATAYGKSAGAALIEEASAKATAGAIKNRADIARAVDQQVRLAVATRIADAAKATATLNDQSAVQEKVNSAVEAGLVPQAAATDAVRDQIQLLPLLAALQVAQQRGYRGAIEQANHAIEDQKAALDRVHKAQIGAQFNADISAGADQLAMLQRELELIRATDAARVHELATLRALQEAEAKRYDPAQAAKFVQQQVRIADQTQRNTTEQYRFDHALDDTLERMHSVASNIADAWGGVGHAIGGAIDILAEYGKRQKEIDDQVKAGTRTQAEATKATGDLQLNSLIGLTDAAKGLFKEHSKGYQAMEAAEKALTVVQLARTAIDVAGGAARMFSTLGPFAFPAIAAMLGVMASLGFHGGGSAGPAPTTNDGTGTVMGDSSAKSDSIKRALDLLNDVDTATMHYSAEMASSLRSIDSQIGNLANLIVRIGGADGINASAGVQTGFKSAIPQVALDAFIGGPIGVVLGPVLRKIPVIGDILGGLQGIVKGLFGTKTSIVGSGIYGSGQTLGDIFSDGFDADYYTDIKKKKKFFGVTSSTKYSTKYSDADPALEQQFGLILKSFDDAILAAGGPLGVATDDISKRLNSFVLDIGKIDLKDLTGAEIQDKLNAVFGAAADKMAATAIPGLDRFQKVGEGAFETLVRVASTVERVTSDLTMLGTSTSKLGIDAKMGLAGMFASVSDFDSAIGTYFQDFYTDAEQTAAKTAQLGQVFASLGMAVPDSIAAYRHLVDAQDLSTAAGQQMYATLLKLAPAFADVATAGQSATNAAAILRERQDLERQLAEAQGDTAKVREMELAAIDPANRALQQQIYALQDQQAAAQAAAQAQQAAAQAAQEAAQKTDALRQAWQSIGDTIMDEVNRIRGIAGNQGQSYALLLSQFNQATDAARHGDQSAASKLPELSKAVLDAAANAAASRQELARVQAQTAASLQQTYDMIHAATVASQASTGALGGSGGSGASAAEAAAWWNRYAPSNDNAETQRLHEELRGIRADMRTGLAAVAGHTKKTARTLEDVTTGPLSLNTVAAA